MDFVCTNNKDYKGGEFEDPITGVIVPEKHVIHVFQEGHHFCFERMLLPRHFKQGKYNNPYNRIEFTKQEIKDIYIKSRETFPQIFLAFSGNDFNAFEEEEEAVQYLLSLDSKGEVYQMAFCDDDELYSLLYPNQLRDVTPCFKI